MKRNVSTRARRAFTLIELLVVIAIIAILAAILFPVFGTIREQTRQGSTMSNMHSVYLGARLFYEDEGRYPSSLFGYAEVPLPANAGNPTLPQARLALPSDIGTASITPMDQATGSFYTDTTSTGRSLNKGYLYREQIKDFNTFINGETPISHQQTGKIATTTAVTPLALPTLDNGTVLANQQVVWTAPSMVAAGSGGCSVYGDTDLPADPLYAGQAKVFYTMDSMDIGPRININDGSMVTDGSGNPVYELHYSPDWTKERYDNYVGCDSVNNKPLPNQLKYKNPPTERTILTYITDHVAFGHSPNVLILLMSGTARTMNYKQALDPTSGYALPFGYH